MTQVIQTKETPPASIETYSGKWFDILNPTPDMIDIESIAHATSMVCRFSGHTRHHYSVAQHSWLGSYFVPKEYRLEFLLHDASEAYIGDMSRPLKHCTEAGKYYREVEARISAVIREKFGLPAVQSDVIHVIDNQMLYAEKAQLMGDLTWSQEAIKVCECPDRTEAEVTIVEHTPKQIEQFFLVRFNQLKGR